MTCLLLGHFNEWDSCGLHCKPMNSHRLDPWGRLRLEKGNSQIIIIFQLNLHAKWESPALLLIYGFPSPFRRIVRLSDNGNRGKISSIEVPIANKLTQPSSTMQRTLLSRFESFTRFERLAACLWRSRVNGSNCLNDLDEDTDLVFP